MLYDIIISIMAISTGLGDVRTVGDGVPAGMDQTKTTTKDDVTEVAPLNVAGGLVLGATNTDGKPLPVKHF